MCGEVGTPDNCVLLSLTGRHLWQSDSKADHNGPMFTPFGRLLLLSHERANA